MKKTVLLNRLFLITCISFVFITGCSARNTGYPNQTGTRNNAYPNQMGATSGNTQGNRLYGINSPSGVAPQGTTNARNQTAGYVGTNPNANKTGTQMSQSMGNDRQRAENIKNQLRGLNGTEQCGVLVNGNTAIVGLLTQGVAKGKRPDVATVEKKVKEIDRSITKVVVTEAPDIVNEIKRMSTDITNTSPANEAKDSFNKLMQRINKVS